MAAARAIIVRTAITITRRSSGGRPTAAASVELGARILGAAAELFLLQGYAATSIEAIAGRAGVSKRTLYARFPDKGAIFPAVVRSLIQSWLSGFELTVEAAPTLEAALTAAARRILDVALSPAALSLHRLVVAEAVNFPELATALRSGGAGDGVIRIARLLHHYWPDTPPARLAFLAQQFQTLILGGPQARAVGLGDPLNPAAQDLWCQDSVALFLRGAVPP